VDALKECYEKDKDTLGLRMWLSERKGTFYTFKAFWIGGPNEAGELKGEQIHRNANIVSIPTTWPRALTQEIVVEKEPSVTALT
jgi:hypothetical protein